MPASIDDPVTAYAAFAGVKFVGYSFAASIIARTYSTPSPNAFAVGLGRTLLGMVVGFAYFNAIGNALGGSPLVFYAGLFPVRLAEWWFIIYAVYDRPLTSLPTDWRNVLAATVWSYCCDVPAVAGVFATGGIGIC